MEMTKDIVTENFVKGLADYTGIDIEKIEVTVPYENYKKSYKDFVEHPFKYYFNALQRKIDKIKRTKELLKMHIDGRREWYYENKIESSREEMIEKYKRSLKKKLKSFYSLMGIITAKIIEKTEVKGTPDKVWIQKSKEVLDLEDKLYEFVYDKIRDVVEFKS